MKITCFGEALWDVFPNHKKIGGAPLNVALRLKSMGVDSGIITRIGNDAMGDEIKKYVEQQGLPIHTFQTDNTYETGKVLVTLDHENTASYTICKPSAWDFIACSDTIVKEVVSTDAIIYGSLACRNNSSRDTLFQLLSVAKFKILDVNLRPPFYTKDVLEKLMNAADFIKLNEEELEEICTMYSIKSKDFKVRIETIAQKTNTKHICVTKGKNGADLFYNNGFYHNNGYVVRVKDTVGAGDSFLATLILLLLKDEEPQKAIDRACAVGAMVAGSVGANLNFSEEEIFDFINSRC